MPTAEDIRVRAISDLQRLLSITWFSVAALRKATWQDFALSSPPVGFTGAELLQYSEVQPAAEDWHMRACLRDAMEIINDALDTIWREVVLVAGLATEPLAGAFHKNNLPAKVEHLQGIGISSRYAGHVLSINRLRACLVHRRGVVGPEDVSPDGTLVVEWRQISAVGRGPEGEVHVRDHHPGEKVQSGWTYSYSSGETKRVFLVGERVDVTFTELAGAYLSLFGFIHDVCGQLSNRIPVGREA